jgi:hypothetical protein
LLVVHIVLMYSFLSNTTPNGKFRAAFLCQRIQFHIYLEFFQLLLFNIQTTAKKIEYIPTILLLLNNTSFYPTPMRFLIRARIPTEAGNKMIQDPDFMKKLDDYMNKFKPEAAYFLPIDGYRAAAFIVNIENNSQVPALKTVLFSFTLL